MDRKHQFCRDTAGFSLLESVIAIGVILVGLVSIVTLSTVTLVGGTATSNRYIATNLAQEAVEVVRQVRDTNWLEYDSDSVTAWNDGLYGFDGATPDYSAVVTLFDKGASGSYLAFNPDSFGDICPAAPFPAYDCTAVWLNSSKQNYFQTTSSMFDSGSADYEQTQFSRLVYLNPICRNATDETDEQVISSGECVDLGADYWQVGVDVVVEVQWLEKGATKSFTLEEYLYDWKY
ncbi:hypothetical protein ACFL2M_00035 [Patescibacteria group bacterium]